MLHHNVVRPSAGTWIVAVGLVMSSVGCPSTTVWLHTMREPDAAVATPQDAGHGGNVTDAGEPDDPHVRDAGATNQHGYAGMSASPPPMHPDAGGGYAGTPPSMAGNSAPVAGNPAPAAGSGGAAGAAGRGGSSAAMSGQEPALPKAPEPCPTLATGMVKMLGTQVELWVGTKSNAQAAPVMIYWHGTGSTPEEASLFYDFAITDVVSQGGIVAAPVMSTNQGDPAEPTAVWLTGDYQLADEIVACAAQQLNIDPHRIYVLGASGGGGMTASMLYARSSYVASVVVNSGAAPSQAQLQDPVHVPPVMTMHGRKGTDVVIIDFALQSQQLVKAIKALHGFSMDCDHGGGHAGAPEDLRKASWQFLNDHPFGVTPEPYASGLPSSFPKYCKVP